MKIDFSKIKINVLSKQQSEKSIQEYKVFYKTHLTNVKNREEVLMKLNSLNTKIRQIEPKTVAMVSDLKITSIESEIFELLNNHFSPLLSD